ncbi:MGF 360-2L [African swine fever virus]|uniref:MGF 360-2L n=1 Tax=African swine fever virus TaxID=10497 RepID=A0A894ZSZ3_ASF|nr:MGF 360-2L [African swine fever virus]
MSTPPSLQVLVKKVLLDLVFLI